MSTYSLTLRSEKGSKLTIEELDNNFLFLSENGGSGPQGPVGPSGLIGPQGPTGPSVGGSGYIEIISMTISASELTPTFLEPIEIIPAPGIGKMAVPLWGRFRMINGGTKWGNYFQIYPQSKDIEPGSPGKYLISPIKNS
jgi:hypothetical protein